MPNTRQPVVPAQVPSSPVIDSNGRMSFEWVKWFQNVATAINAALSQDGQVIGYIAPTAHVSGRTTNLGTVLQGLSDTGQVDALALPAATDTSAGVVVLPSGATTNSLGSASLQDTSAFDAAGSATAASNAALASAKVYADSAAAAAAGSAISYSTNAGNLTGTVPPTTLPPATPQVTFGSGAPTSTPSAGTGEYYDTSATPPHHYIYYTGSWHQVS